MVTLAGHGDGRGRNRPMTQRTRYREEEAVRASDGPAQSPEDDIDALTEQIIGIWRGILGLPDITADSHLLDLGATSLTAVRIRSRIRAELGREVDLIEFLEHPTPRELAEVVAGAPPWSGPELWQELQWDSDPASDTPL